MQMKGTLSLSAHDLVAPILLHRTKHFHFLYCSTLIKFWKKLGKFSSVSFKVASYDTHKSYSRRFFAPLVLLLKYFYFCSETLFYQSHFDRSKKPYRFVFRNVLGKQEIKMSSLYPTDTHFVALLIYANCLIAWNYWLTRLESWLPDYPREK